MSWRLIRTGVLVLSALAVAACSRGIPAPVEYRSAAPVQTSRAADTVPRGPVSSAAHQSDKSTAAAGRAIEPRPLAVEATAVRLERNPSKAVDPIQPGVYIVRPGDTLFAISQRSQVALRDLIDINGLEAPYQLNAGQSLTIPAVRYHLVKPGDTVTSIAEAHSVSMRALVMANDIEQPFVIRAGDRLRLPAAVQEDTAVEIAQAAAPLAAPTPVPPLKPHATAKALSLPKPGETPRPAYRPSGRDGAPPLPAYKPGVELVRAEPTPAVIPQPPQRAGRRFAWPVRGTVISGFGPKSGGFYNDGINIAVRSGTAVTAAENGVVTYVGNELRGFGNLVLVRHQGGWVTAYAHVADISVKPGQIVRRGQTIARAGRSGRVSSPQLHFEIRKGRRAVDPLRHLPKQRTAAKTANAAEAPDAIYSSVLPSLPARS